MGVEVQHDALGGFRGCDHPLAVLVRRVLQRVTGRSDVTRIGGINLSSTLLTYEEEIEGKKEKCFCLPLWTQVTTVYSEQMRSINHCLYSTCGKALNAEWICLSHYVLAIENG